MSIENGSLDDVSMTMLHGNQFVCDCHSRYLVSWLLGNRFPSNSKLECSTPEHLTNFPLVQVKSVQCENRYWLANDVVITNTTSDSASMTWNPMKNVPGFIRTRIVGSKANKIGFDEKVQAVTLMKGTF